LFDTPAAAGGALAIAGFVKPKPEAKCGVVQQSALLLHILAPSFYVAVTIVVHLAAAASVG
jgi:hypothetical protein